MKICFFTENYHKGGLDTFLINLINAWPNANDDLYLICNSTHPGLQTIVNKVKRQLRIIHYDTIFNMGVNLTPYRKIIRGLTYRMFQHTLIFGWHIVCLRLFFPKFFFDRLMVVNGGYPASLLCRSAVVAWKLFSAKPKAILNIHNSPPKTRWYYFIPEWLVDKAVLSCALAVITVSQNCLMSIRDRNAFAKISNLYYIRNGLLDPLEERSNYIVRTPIAVSKPYCLMLATYEPRKGHEYLINAFRQVVNRFPGVNLLICGDGSQLDKNRILECIRVNNLTQHVTLHDFIENPSRLIAEAAIIVVPSQAYESFGLTIIEAMALSTPIVATNVGGIPEVLELTGAGVVVDRESTADFARALMEILDDLTLQQHMGSNGRKAYESFYTATQMANSYYTHFINPK
jgi:glycosyltransferase involved in cell wall biosynthesis